MSIPNGTEITKNGSRGIVIDGAVKKSGPNKGRIEVMWIGGRYTVSEWPAEVTVLGSETDTLTALVTIQLTPGAEGTEFASEFVYYLTEKESPFWGDYGPDAWGGYEGPTLNTVRVDILGSGA